MSPIALFAYNRPAHLRAALDAIERAQARLKERLPLYIFCDAPKQKNDDRVAATRSIARQHPRAIVIERESNLGFENLTSGISQMCQEWGEVIIIEDDVIIAPDFLEYMVAALRRYAQEPQVFSISGFMYFDAQPVHPSFFFLPHPFIWGWATWKRAWDHYEYRPIAWETTLQDRAFRDLFDCYGSIKFSKMMEKTMRGQWNTWDIQWMFCQIRAGGLTLYPYQSLVWNCGSGGGTHGDPAKDHSITLGEREEYIHGNLNLSDFQQPRCPDLGGFPHCISYDKKALRYLARTFLHEWQRREPRGKWKGKLLWNWLCTQVTHRPRPR